MPRVFDPAVAERKRKNTAIFNETTEVIRRGYYMSPSGRKVVLPSYDAMISGAECIHSELPYSTAPKNANTTVVKVENADCLVSAQRLVSEGYNPALLNFASAGHPGGGVETGARAQEETICRRSTLSRSIYTFSADYASRYGYNHVPGNNYPLSDNNYSIIYSPDVTVFREGIDCTFMETPYNVAVITCAALNLNGKYPIKLTADGHMPKEAVDMTLNKIRAIFRLALRHGHDSLVLGAFGCGAFRNPPAEVAALFHKVMEEQEFKDRFRYITFSIIEDHNSGGVNLAAFEKEFAGDVPAEDACGLYGGVEYDFEDLPMKRRIDLVETDHDTSFCAFNIDGRWGLFANALAGLGNGTSSYIAVGEPFGYKSIKIARLQYRFNAYVALESGDGWEILALGCDEAARLMATGKTFNEAHDALADRIGLHLTLWDNLYMAPEFTPERISSLEPCEVFVFGSNLAGQHGAGAARFAYESLGAEWGVGVGPTGQCYAIPTMHGGPDSIKPYVDEFISYARENSQKIFLVTPIGCGIAGFKVSDIAPLFRDALDLDNVVLPESFVKVLK